MQIGSLLNLRRVDTDKGLSLDQELMVRIREEQIALLYRNAPTGFVVSIAVGLLLIVTLSGHVSLERLISWYVLLLMVTAIRYSINQRYQNSTQESRQSKYWETLFLLGTASAGFIWGLSIIMLFPPDAVAYQFFIALVLAAMVGGAVAVFSARKSVYTAFAVTILLPVILRFLYENDSVHNALAIMVMIYLAGMIITARHTEQVIRLALTLRFDNQELMEEISQRQQIEAALRSSEERFRDFTESAGDFFWELDSQLRFTDVSERFHEITGLERLQVLDQPVIKILTRYGLDPDVREAFAGHLERRQKLENMELNWRQAEAGRRILLFNGRPIFDHQGDFRGYRGVGRDVTNERHIAQLMHHQAKHDALTGLVNRREFMRRLENALLHSQQDDASYVLCYLDLDQFKIVNDTVGHTAGDELLKELAGVLCGRLRTRDTLSRVGGDEFALLLENCKLDDGVQVAESLLAVLADFRFHWEDQEFLIGASIGVVPISAETETARQVLSQADLACYTAKELGRNRLYVYHAEDLELSRMESQMALVSRLQIALKHDQFRLYRQPIRALKDDQVEHYELLLRLEEPSGKILSPRSFIPAAERYGIMKEIDRWVIENALNVYARPNGNAVDTAFSINLSGNSLNDEELLSWILSQLKRSKVAPNRICFEITETAAIRNLNQAKQVINELKAEGCRFALDDFGSGLSSFTYIKYLPVDYLKIDGSFVADMEEDATANAMVAAINEMGHVLGMKTVAEHVETDRMLKVMREIGVDYVQGYALGEPTPLVAASRRTIDK
jgi:diguanylate cyclase (GGDEF)-like protein/PAS domain S-box-containing protein